MNRIETKLRELIETELKSCSMDYGCVTPLYVYRMMGGEFSMEEIEKGLLKLRNQEFLNLR